MLVNDIANIILEDDTEPDWLIRDMMTQSSLICLGGEPGAGKSYVSYTIGLAIAGGIRTLSGLVYGGEPKCVLYFDDENSKADRDKYIKRSWTALTENMPDSQKYEMLDKLTDNFWPVHYQLGGDDWPDVVANCIETVTEVRGSSPHAMVFDTAASCFNIQEENNNSEAANNVKAIRRLMALGDPPLTALVLKHAKIRSDRGRRTLRGAKAWIGMADMVLFQVKAAGRPRKDGLSLTRLEPDKTRAYGLSRTIYITPSYTDDKRSGLRLDASFNASREHQQKEQEEDELLDTVE